MRARFLTEKHQVRMLGLLPSEFVDTNSDAYGKTWEEFLFPGSTSPLPDLPRSLELARKSYFSILFPDIRESVRFPDG